MRVVMMGTGTFAEPIFEALIGAFGADVVGLMTQPQRQTGNRRGSTRQTGQGMAVIARQAGIAVAQPENINTPEGIALLSAMRPDLVVVAAYGQILSGDVLAVPTCGTINVHASLLPKYRGAAPVAYAILNGDKQTGVTIIKVTPGLDSGDMILQETTDILPDDTTGTLEARLAQMGARLAVEAARRYAQGGPVEGVKQDAALVTKAPKITKNFGLIDWSKPAEYLERFVRAMQPWPTAYTFLHRPGKEPMRIIVNKASVYAGLLTDIPPGTPIVAAHLFPSVLLVKAGDGCGIGICDVQPAGKKKMTAEEFLRGYPVVEGMRFGPEVLS